MSRVIFSSMLCFWVLAGWVGAVLALSTDSEQPIHIEADQAELDEKRQVTVYKGSVVVIQGSMRIEADRVDVFYSEDRELDKAIAVGKPARYRQLSDDSKAPVRAKARRMEYYALKNLLYLLDNAKVTQGRETVTGDRITYDTLRHRARAEATDGDDERVRIVIEPKKEPAVTPEP